MMEEVYRSIVDGITPVTRSSAYVRDPGPGCIRAGVCQNKQLLRMLDTAATQIGDLIAREERRMEPTRALWCEQGEHSFSGKAPHKVLNISSSSGDGAESENQTVTTCIPCSTKLPLPPGRLGTPLAAPVAAVPVAGGYRPDEPGF